MRPPMLMKGLDERLRSTRELGGISSRELGALAGLSETYPGLIESKEREEVGADAVAKLAKVLGVTTDYLILGVGKSPTKRQVTAAVAVARAVRGAA
jgi:transcriptional regulator with XRE-family HTH domain